MMIGYLLKGFQLTCIAGEEYGRRNAGISVVSVPRIFRFAKQMQHHADKTGQYGYTRGYAQQSGQIWTQFAEICNNIYYLYLYLKLVHVIIYLFLRLPLKPLLMRKNLTWK